MNLVLLKAVTLCRFHLWKYMVLCPLLKWKSWSESSPNFCRFKQFHRIVSPLSAKMCQSHLFKLISYRTEEQIVVLANWHFSVAISFCKFLAEKKANINNNNNNNSFIVFSNHNCHGTPFNVMKIIQTILNVHFSLSSW